MSVIRTGTTQKYASGWETAFGKTDKSGKASGKTAKAASTKTAKVSAPKAGKAKVGAAKAGKPGAAKVAVKSKTKMAAKRSPVAKKKPARRGAKK